jgi:hypothetical protein
MQKSRPYPSSVTVELPQVTDRMINVEFGAKGIEVDLRFRVDRLCNERIGKLRRSVTCTIESTAAVEFLMTEACTE